jgi:microsomal dipeptidase-like Zn-dependent dipeptidase
MMCCMSPAPIIDALQYCNWSPEIFRQMREGGVTAVHVTICYHENFRETVANIAAWNRRFEEHRDRLLHARSGADVRQAQAEGRTAIIFGLQNCSPIEDDIGLVEICHQLGIRFMQLTYNNQSLLASGCYESEDSGITRMGREVIREMNRVGLVIDMSHSGERSTLEAIDISARPITVTHANPSFWHPGRRNKSNAVLKALTARNGMLGFSLYPHHLKDGSHCRMEDFCAMVARTAEMVGADHLGIGSDLCQNQPDSVVTWMRNGRWTRTLDFGEGSAAAAGFPPQPPWFRDNRDFHKIAEGLRAVGFSGTEVDGIMGANWLRFFDDSFVPAR